jgi:hypothetical protein
MQNRLSTPLLDSSLAQPLLNICSSVGKSREAEDFREQLGELQQWSAASGLELGELNIPGARVIGDAQVLRALEGSPHHTALCEHAKEYEKYLHRLAKVYLPVLAIIAIASQRRAVYFPRAIVDPRVVLTTSEECPVGLGEFSGPGIAAFPEPMVPAILRDSLSLSDARAGRLTVHSITAALDRAFSWLRSGREHNRGDEKVLRLWFAVESLLSANWFVLPETADDKFVRGELKRAI